MADDAVNKFVNVTGSSVEDAIKYLSICDNNVSLAVECFVDQQPQTSNGGGEDADNVRAPIPSRTDRLVDEQVRVGRLGKRSANAFDFHPNERDFSNNRYANPLARKKFQGLAELFKPPTDISFIGTLEGAKTRGKILKKWLLINVQDITDFKCQALNRDLWCKPDVRSIIDQHFVFWQIYRDSLEGEHFMRFYACANSPFVGVIDPGTGELMKQWSSLSKEQFVSEIMLFLSENFDTLLSPVRSPPSKRPCNSRTRSVLNDITEVITNGSGVPAPVPASPGPSSSSSQPSSSSSQPCSDDQPGPSTRIVNGEIITHGTLSNPAKAAPIDPSKLNITFRLPNGSRRQEAFGRHTVCSDLYSWLSSNGYVDHVIWTPFPKVGVPNDRTSVVDAVGSDRCMLFVEDKYD